jgi:hypothetical protein
MSRMRIFSRARISTLAAFFLLAALSIVAAPAAVAGTTGPAVSPSANPTAYVGLEDTNNGCAGMVPINTATNTAETPEQVGPACGADNEEAYALAVSPNGGTIYAVTGLATGNSGDGDVVPVSTTTGASGSEIKVGLIAWVPTAIAITPTGPRPSWPTQATACTPHQARSIPSRPSTSSPGRRAAPLLSGTTRMASLSRRTAAPPMSPIPVAILSRPLMSARTRPARLSR